MGDLHVQHIFGHLRVSCMKFSHRATYWLAINTIACIGSRALSMAYGYDACSQQPVCVIVMLRYHFFRFRYDVDIDI